MAIASSLGIHCLSHTVLLKGLHCPTVTWSPSSTRKAGETCAARFLCRFSYLEYLGMKWRYSRRMTRVRCIFVETTVPVRIRPRMETSPVKGHFLSTRLKLIRTQSSARGKVSKDCPRESENETLPTYEPSIAVLGVLKPNPTSLYHLRPPFPTLVLLVLFDFWLTKICGCFWKARSDCTVNSVAMFAVG